MRGIVLSKASAAVAVAVALLFGVAASADAQTYVDPSGATYTYPQPSYGATYRTYDRGVLPGFAPRGGIGTTPFLGNTRGLGAYSYNDDQPRQVRTYHRIYSNRRYRAWPR